MRWLLLAFLIGAAAAACACASAPAAQPTQTRAQRQTLEKRPREYKTPASYEPREIGYYPKTGKPLTYDHKPRVEMVDATTGRYAFKWVGYDHKEKSVIFQRADMIDVIVSATASKTPEGLYLYTYEVQNLPSSGTQLSGFIVQNFADDAKPVEVNGKQATPADLVLLDAFRGAQRDAQPPNLAGVHVGQMSRLIQEFKDGSWIHFGLLPSFEPPVTPGRSIEVKVLSSAPPGLVGCRAIGGTLSLTGVDEHMPIDLENLLPGYEEYPRGYTLGPREDLKSLTPRARRLRARPTPADA
jgi:hypothetical protein